MESSGHLVVHPWQFNTEEGIKNASLVSFQPVLIDIFDRDKCHTDGQSLDIDTIEFRDYSDTGKPLIENIKPNGIQSVRRGIKAYNTLLQDEDTNIEMTIDGVNIQHNVIYKRVFGKSLNDAGRYYTLGNFQNAKSVYRQTLKINDNPTCEVDYSHMHPAILATLNNKILPTNVYMVPDGILPIKAGAEPNEAKKQIRALSKLGVMIIINSNNKRSAVSALWKAIKDKEDIVNLLDLRITSNTVNRGLVNSFIEALISNLSFAPEDELFNTNLWLTLQNRDSKIATFVINDFVERGKVCLCWHDSFVVECDQLDNLERLMKEAWRYVLGNDDNCNVTLEYYSGEDRPATYLWPPKKVQPCNAN